MSEPKQAPEHPSRRAFMNPRPKPAQAHIASLLVQTWPDKTAAISGHLKRIPGIDTHGDADGKLIVTVEAENDDQLVQLVGAIEAADGVVCASLVYHQIEDHDHG